MNEKLKKIDKIVIGVVVGLVFTAIGFLLSYPVLTRGQDMSFAQYLNYAQVGADRQNILIFCLLPNMFLFYLTNFRWNLNEFTKGLVGLTLILGLLLVILTVI